jgi:hypothetical protein
MGTQTALCQNAPRKDTVLPKVDSLKAAIVTATLRPRMKGDTMEYSTGNIRLRPNANVEELLSRLPGLQIDNAGNITFNGEKIQHLLVDGEDIFGSSPILVTRNFDASKIARVQVLDRKSDQTLFTGIDDGTRTKTLNLVLKESAKDGYSGKVEAGGSTDGYYNTSGVLAGFRRKEQFTALGLAANTGVLGPPVASSSGVSTAPLTGVTDALNASAGSGIPQYAGVDLHYANTWNGEADHLSANYQYSHYNTNPLTTIFTEQTQPGSIYQQFQQSQSTNQQMQHWLYGVYDWAPNSRTAFHFVFNAGSGQGENQYSSGGTGSINGSLVNSTQRTIRDLATKHQGGGEVNWRVQLGRSERVLSMSFNMSKSEAITNGYLYSLTRFSTSTGPLQSQDTVDQRKQFVDPPLSLAGKINFTEPLWRSNVLAFSYSFSRTENDALQGTYSRGDGKYGDLIDSLSSHLSTQTTFQFTRLNLQGNGKRVSYVIGNDLIGYRYVQQDLLTNSALRQSYLNWTPRVAVSYTPDPSLSLRFLYTSYTQQPSAAQLQPVRNNNDPLHLTLGNPNLQPALYQYFHLDFHRLKAWIINLDLNVYLISNSISTRTTTDSLGRQISQPLNVNGGQTARGNFFVSRKLAGWDIGFQSSGSYSRTVSFVNAGLSNNDAFTGGGGFSLNKFVPGRYSLQFTTTIAHFNQVSSINTSAPLHYWTQFHSAALTLYMLRGFEINTNTTYTWQQKTSAFPGSPSVLLWNGYISRSFLVNRLVIKAQINDLLNQAAGITRSNTGNVNTETTTNILRRYWLLSVSYHFDKKFSRK